MTIAPGTELAHYRIVAQLGAGGMGEVYRAQDPRLDRDIALKVIRRALVTDEAALDRLLREATLASALNHPNIVTIYETGLVGADRYIAMELVEGTTLRALASQGVPLSRLLAIARQVAEALAVAHAAQIVHRDIKPENVMVRPDGYVKLLDFGLARLQPDALAAGSTRPGATETGMVLGTIGYMAPEQARGERVAPEADVFSLGVLLYELVTGRHPFAAPSQLGMLHALMWEAPEPPSLLNTDLPRAIDQLILEMLQKDPRLRPGASEAMFRLNLAHDSTVAVALASAAPTRPAAVSASVVGRDHELSLMVQDFERAARGSGRIVVVSGEAGMGKTTLVDAFLDHLQQRGDPVRVGRGRCSERLAGSEAYLPVLEVLDGLQKNEQLGSLSRLIRAIAPSWYAQIMPPAENDSSAARLAAETSGGSQERLKREIAALLAEVGRMQPVVLCFDDLHWADPSTTDLLGYLGRRIDAARVLIVATCRPSALAQARHPFLPLKLDLISRGLCREITPSTLDVAAVDRYVALQFPEHAFPPGFARVIHQRTEGNPLFMADVLRELRRAQVIRQQDGRWIVVERLDAVASDLPQSIVSLIQRKLDALDDGDRKLLAAASVQGVDFDSAVVARAVGAPEHEVEDRLERLEREHALVKFVDEHEGHDRSLTLRYRFAHHLYHTAIFDSLRLTRRVALSRAIADALIARIGPNLCDCAADIAVILEGARDHVRAAEYWNMAAQSAARLYAHGETARLAQHGLALLASEPDSPARAAAELDLQMTYGLAIKTGEGYAVQAVGAAYARARELARRVEDPARVVPVLIGLSAHHIVSGDIRTAHEIALEMRTLFDRLGDPHLQMIGEWSIGVALFHLGELQASHEHLGRGLALYDPAFHRPRVWQTGIEPGIFCRCEYSRTLTLLGYPDQGLACVQDAVAQARALDHPQPLAFALLFEIFAHLARRSPRDVQRTYEQLAVVCHAHGIAQEVQWAAPLCGRAFIELGDSQRGLRVIEEGIAAHTLTRSALLRPYYFIMLSGAQLRSGHFDRAQRALDEAARWSNETGQHAYDAEHARLQAEVQIARGAPPDAIEATYRRALEISRTQGARWLQLRASRGCAHFLVSQGRTGEARQLLVPICEAITEGRDTPDYLYADALLKTL